MPEVIPVTKDQIIEWLDNPVTLVLKKFAQQELDDTIIAQGLDSFHPFQPERTQEILAGLNGARNVWEDVLEALSGEGLMYEEEESE